MIEELIKGMLMGAVAVVAGFKFGRPAAWVVGKIRDSREG